MMSMVRNPMTANVPTMMRMILLDLCIAWLELCIASNSRARSAEKASCIDCNPLAKRFRILSGGLFGFPTVLLDGELSSLELFVQLQIGVEQCLGVRFLEVAGGRRRRAALSAEALPRGRGQHQC